MVYGDSIWYIFWSPSGRAVRPWILRMPHRPPFGRPSAAIRPPFGWPSAGSWVFFCAHKKDSLDEGGQGRAKPESRRSLKAGEA